MSIIAEILDTHGMEYEYVDGDDIIGLTRPFEKIYVRDVYFWILRSVYPEYDGETFIQISNSLPPFNTAVVDISNMDAGDPSVNVELVLRPIVTFMIKILR